MTHEEKIAQWIGEGKIGTEIGAGDAPLPGLNPPPIYVDCFKSFGSMQCAADYYGHATSLPFHDHSLDYVIASHVLEHVANPIAALAEWYRVLRPGGIIYLVVPNRRATWDRHRPLTTVEHMQEDFIAQTTAADATHIDDFVNDVVWSEWCPTIPAEDVPAKKIEIAQILHASVARGESINLHFHTFEAENIRSLIEGLTTWPVRRFKWELLEVVEGFPARNPDGVLAVVRSVLKSWRARAVADAFRLRTFNNPHAAVRDDAVPFAEWATRTPGEGGVE